MNSLSSKLILLAEDDANAREVAALILEAEGYRVRTAANGTLALKMLAQEDDYDLLLSDVIMPGGIDGLQLARRARVLSSRLPILLTSGDEPLPEADLPTHTEFLPKPYDRGGLLDAVRRALPDAAAQDF